MTKFLLDNGASVDQQRSMFCFPPLMAAVVALDIDKIKLLLNFGADSLAKTSCRSFFRCCSASCRSRSRLIFHSVYQGVLGLMRLIHYGDRTIVDHVKYAIESSGISVEVKEKLQEILNILEIN